MEVRECEGAIDPNRTGVTREGHVFPPERILFLSPFEEEIHGPHPIQVRSSTIVRWESERGRASRARSQRQAPASLRNGVAGE